MTSPVSDAANAEFQADKIHGNGRRILEEGHLIRFKEFVEQTEKNWGKSSFKMDMSFSDSGFTFPIILIQTFRKIQATRSKSLEMPTEEYQYCLRWMLRKGADINAKDGLQRTVAHWAVLTQAHDMLSVILKEHCDPLAQDSEGQTVAHLAVRIGCPESLNVLHETVPHSGVLTEASVSSGATPLIYAVQIGSQDIVEQLLRFGVDVNQQETNKYNRTALHYALYTNAPNIFELLLQNNARTDIPDYKDRSLDDRVAEHANPIFERMVKASKQPDRGDSLQADSLTNLMRACQENDIDLVQKLLIKPSKMDLDAVDAETGKTALHFCVEHETTECAEVLMAKAPELAAVHDNDGFTALHLATVAGNVNFMSALLKVGADVDVMDKEQHSCVHWAVACGQMEALDELIKHSAKLGLADVYGATPLHYAAQVNIFILFLTYAISRKVYLEKCSRNWNN